ncbi:manganese superoxide dismutase AAC36583-Penicillium chrysogenum [Paecilomyces variotii No. 5]|uniref:Superoxide dismutase n=1 Tax=Byssochlamys spectabilis (strain No. 5 / NBRC 109023) TaxID=1356009 RepID=V5GBV8_BYSSN|nr:manganese superoxide dismutase AAC36583-Penicillium chrysogenum [Paecilomyces variotii No. 5]
MASTTYTLPPLPYAYNALEPVISQQIMELHHKKHHQTYINNLNAALASQATATQANDVPQLISLQQKIKFNGGGHINHSLFWKNLTPPGTKEANIDAAPTLKNAIVSRWGSEKGFTDAFNAALLGIQGSGWGWLVANKPSGKLEIITTHDQDPVPSPDIPIFGVDMWEHAYYLQYLNNKAGYVEGIWKIINWATAEERFKNGVDSSAILKASI